VAGGTSSHVRTQRTGDGPEDPVANREHRPDDDVAPAVPREDAGPRPGEHPTVRRSGGKRSTGIVLAVVLVLALLMYAAIAAGIFTGNS
jgi:hypothetical protein